MTSFLPEVQAFTAYLEAAITANPDYAQMMDADQLAFRMSLIEEIERLYPDAMWGD